MFFVFISLLITNLLLLSKLSIAVLCALFSLVDYRPVPTLLLIGHLLRYRKESASSSTWIQLFFTNQGHLLRHLTNTTSITAQFPFLAITEVNYSDPFFPIAILHSDVRRSHFPIISQSPHSLCQLSYCLFFGCLLSSTSCRSETPNADVSPPFRLGIVINCPIRSSLIVHEHSRILRKATKS